LTVSDVTAVEPWKGLMEENSAGTLPSAIPVFLAQGTVDDTVPEDVTASYMTKICDAGSSVTMDVLPGVGHLDTAKNAAPAFIDWLGSIDAGQPVTNNCP
ncbi:MAG: lipase family protein, partial [Devosia sp.]